MALYPTKIADYIKTPTDQPIDPVQMADYTGLRNEILAIQGELGTDPAGSLTTVAARLGVQFSPTGGLKNFEFGSFTTDFAASRTVTLASGRFTEAPVVLCMNATGMASSGEAVIFYTSSESKDGFQVSAYRAGGGSPTASTTVHWVALRPPGADADTEEGATDSNGDIPAAGLSPDARIVNNRPYYHDAARQRWLSYETVVFRWHDNSSGITAGTYMKLGNATAPRLHIPEDMVLCSIQTWSAFTGTVSDTDFELYDATSPISGAIFTATSTQGNGDDTFNLDIPADTELRCYMTPGASDSVTNPTCWITLRYTR